MGHKVPMRETDWIVGTREHLGDCGQRGKRGLCDHHRGWKVVSGPQPPLGTALAFTLEKLPPPQLDLQGLLYLSQGNSLYSPISALPTFFSICRKGHRKRNSARKRVPKLNSHYVVIKPLGGLNPPAQSCLTEPAAIEEMFNSLHVPKQEPGATCGSCILKFRWWDFPVGVLRSRLHTPDAAGAGLSPGRGN